MNPCRHCCWCTRRRRGAPGGRAPRSQGRGAIPIPKQAETLARLTPRQKYYCLSLLSRGAACFVSENENVPRLHVCLSPRCFIFAWQLFPRYFRFLRTKSTTTYVYKHLYTRPTRSRAGSSSMTASAGRISGQRPTIDSFLKYGCSTPSEVCPGFPRGSPRLPWEPILPRPSRGSRGSPAWLSRETGSSHGR